MRGNKINMKKFVKAIVLCILIITIVMSEDFYLFKVDEMQIVLEYVDHCDYIVYNDCICALLTSVHQ